MTAPFSRSLFRPAFRSCLCLPPFRFFGAAGLLLALSLPAPAVSQGLLKTAANGDPDTLEVFVLYVEFDDETDLNNDPATTGRGLFGSDTETDYTLDPNGPSLRRSAAYLTKRFELVQDYFDKVSGGRVVILPRLFPTPASDSSPVPLGTNYRLSRSMKFYNPALEDKAAKQKTSDFAEQRAVQLMRFVTDAARKHDIGNPALNPFKIAHDEALMNPSPNRHRAFLIFHAGHSRLVDGGTLGYLGANTPNDFTDFFVTKPDFSYLAEADGYEGDSLGVLVNGDNDTISQFMMLSESASQDGINWGINGILINQLARQMGMPDLFDVVKGISQVGTFDVMDFAGYNTMQGFLPVFPSAWSRTFMGWDDPAVARPGDAGDSAWSTYRIHAADLPGADRIRTLKVPINEREYLLIENRQRAAGDDSATVWFSTQDPGNPLDATFGHADSVTVPYAFLDSLFVDSVCTSYEGSRCTDRAPNPKRPSGIITRASHYDMGLPGNGLLVWHVNEWFMELLLPSGAVNAYLGDTLRSQYKGLELVEADGVPSIGKEFSDPLGQPAFDYGTARDMLPHIYRKRKNPPKDTSWTEPDTLTVIGSYGFANTNAWNDGRTHIQIEALLPASSVLAPGISSFSGDSVRTVRDSVITVRIHWPDNNTVRRPPGSLWPVRTAAAGNPRAVSVLRDGNGRAHVVSASDSGLLQTYTAAGRLALAARDTVRDAGSYDSVEVLLSSGNTRPDNAAPVNSLADPVSTPAGRVLGSAVISDSILAVLMPQGLRLVQARADSLNAGWDPDTTIALNVNGGQDTLIAFAGKAGPMVWGGRVFALDSAGALRWWNAAGGAAGSAVLPTGDWHALAGIAFGTGAEPQVIAAGRAVGIGAAVRVNPAAVTPQAVNLQPAWGSGWATDTTEIFSVTVSDFNRDGHEDALLLGSRGSALLMDVRTDRQGRALAGWPQKLPRSAVFTDSLGTYVSEDRSPPALSDLDRDGRPDILFTGVNGLFALDARGAVLPGWPFRMQPHQAVGFGYANRNLAGGVVGSTPLTLSAGRARVLVASPDGLIYAVDSTGHALDYTSFAGGGATGVLMSNNADWPLTAGGLTLDSNRVPFVHIALARFDSGAGSLNLIAQTATGSLNVWNLQDAQTAPSNWTMPGGDPGRSQRLDASVLADTALVVPAESIEEFHLYPSPLRGGIAKIHLKIGAAAGSARIRVYDLSGRAVHDATFPILAGGTQPVRTLDLSRLGPDVYTVLCEVSFAGGKKSKWQRFGVVK